MVALCACVRACVCIVTVEKVVADELVCVCVVCDRKAEYCADSQAVESARRGSRVPATGPQSVSSMSHSLTTAVSSQHFVHSVNSVILM